MIKFLASGLTNCS